MTESVNPTGRSIELEIEVPGTPEEVWTAIASGPGITSWYVPHEVTEQTGGSATARFGDGPEMAIEGRVAAWEPPRRIVFDGGEGVVGLAFEWLVEAKDGGTCVVRLVNSGFGTGTEWDDHYDQMTEGWRMFMTNLRLHLENFSGQAAQAGLPAGQWPGPSAAAWAQLAAGTGLPVSNAVGDSVKLSAGGAPTLVGTVAEATNTRVNLVLTEPCPGTAIIAAEGGDEVMVSIWTYLYGSQAVELTAACEQGWGQWLADTPGGD